MRSRSRGSQAAGEAVPKLQNLNLASLKRASLKAASPDRKVDAPKETGGSEAAPLRPDRYRRWRQSSRPPATTASTTPEPATARRHRRRARTSACTARRDGVATAMPRSRRWTAAPADFPLVR